MEAALFLSSNENECSTFSPFRLQSVLRVMLAKILSLQYLVLVQLVSDAIPSPVVELCYQNEAMESKRDTCNIVACVGLALAAATYKKWLQKSSDFFPLKIL